MTILGILPSLVLVIFSFGSIWLLYKGAQKLDEHEQLRKKKLELKMREMEAASEEKILQMEQKNDNTKAETTIISSVSMSPAVHTDPKLIMAQVKCVQCGAAIESGSSFCRFCGTPVPDITQKAEIKIETVNKARIRREELKHELDVKKLETESKAKRIEERRQIVWGIIGVAFVLGLFYICKLFAR